MAYSIKTNILKQVSEAVLIQLTDDANTGLVIDETVTQAIADADAEIDSYCGKRYTVPFVIVPEMILKISVDIAIYNLYARRKGAPEDRQKRYDNAVRFLRDVSKGVVALDAGTEITSEAADNFSSVEAEDRLFSRTKMKDY